MADLQSTNRTKLSKVRETTLGVTPDTPAFKEIRNTSSSLSASPQTTTTNEIRSDRQVTDLILVGIQAQGDVGGELAFAVYDDDIEEAMQGTWLNKPVIVVATADTEISDVTATTLTVGSGLGTPFKTGQLVALSGLPTAGNNKLARVASSTGTTVVFPASTFAVEAAPIPVGATARVVGFEGASADIVATVTLGNALTSTALDFTTLGLSVGEWLKLGGGSAGDSFATAALNGWARISAIAAGRLSFDIVPSGWVADVGTGKTIRAFVGDIVRNGVTKRSNTIERQYLDHSPASYELFRGMTLNTFNLQLQQKTIATLTKGYMGTTALVGPTRTAGATDIAAPTNDVLNTSSNVGDIAVDGVTVSGPNFVTNASIEINNNLRMQDAAGNLGAVGIGNGEFTVTGQMETYFGSPAIYQKVLDNSRTSFSTRLGRTDGTRETLHFDLPSIKYSGGSPSISGKNADVMLNGQYQALRHPTLGYTMQVSRFWYLPAVA